MSKHQIVPPATIRIERGSATERLYKLEERRAELMKDIAREWLKVCRPDLAKNDAQDFELWTRAIPQTLLDTLEAYSIDTARAAAVAFLDAHPVERPEIVAMRAGDFYNIEGPDAHVAGKALDLVAARTTRGGEELTVLGIPAHRLAEWSKIIADATGRKVVAVTSPR